MKVLPICEASLSHRTLCVGNLGQVPITVYTCITYFTGWPQKIQITPLPKKKQMTGPILKLTYV